MSAGLLPKAILVAQSKDRLRYALALPSRAYKLEISMICSGVANHIIMDLLATCAGSTNSSRCNPQHQKSDLVSTINKAAPKAYRAERAIITVFLSPIQSSAQSKATAPRPAVQFIPLPKTIISFNNFHLFRCEMSF